MSRRLLMLVWTLLVLYPRPHLLLESALRAYHPPIDPDAVRDLARILPDDPRVIEQLVNGSLVEYAVPWKTHGIPWYFPSVTEVLEHGQGDCQARAILFASILRAKGIPATLVGSFDHLWVDYPGKHANRYENREVAIAAQAENGGYRLRWPGLVRWRESWEIERAYFLDPMPLTRRWLLVAGWCLILFRPSRKASTQRRVGAEAPRGWIGVPAAAQLHPRVGRLLLKVGAITSLR